MVTELFRLWSAELPLRVEEPCTTAGTAVTGTAGMIVDLLPFIGDADEDLALWCAAGTDPTTTGAPCEPVAMAGAAGRLGAPAAEAYDGAEGTWVEFGAGIFCWLAVDVIREDGGV